MTKPTRGVTILIATYNASALLAETLTSLSEMEKVPGLPWEVLIIDNNSTDKTVELARSVWKESADLRIINETQQGTGYAKFRGMSEAKYAYVGFVDQDNRVSHDWMRKVVGYLDAVPQAALVCAKGTPIFEVEKPVWFDRFQQNYAVGPQALSNGAGHDINRFFYTAGSLLRKSAFDELLNLGFSPILKSRSGKLLLSGEDTELQMVLKLRGWEIHYQDDIRFEHFMPSGRLTLDYFRRFREGLGASSVYLSLYRHALKDQVERVSTPRAGWRRPLINSFVNLIKDPLAIVASLVPKFASNYRVAKYWSHLGEFRERVRLKSTLDTTQSKLDNWLESVIKKP